MKNFKFPKWKISESTNVGCENIDWANADLVNVHCRFISFVNAGCFFFENPVGWIIKVGLFFKTRWFSF